MPTFFMYCQWNDLVDYHISDQCGNVIMSMCNKIVIGIRGTRRQRGSLRGGGGGGEAVA